MYCNDLPSQQMQQKLLVSQSTHIKGIHTVDEKFQNLGLTILIYVFKSNLQQVITSTGP